MLVKIKSIVKKEAVFSISFVCAVITMFLVPPSVEYIEYIDFRVLCLLFSLMAVVAGMNVVGAFRYLTFKLMKSIKNGRILGTTLVMLPFFTSMFITNDVALIVFIPFTLALLAQLRCERSIIPIIVLQTVAANLGSMATPVGNPQNLFLYSAFNLSFSEFTSVVLPLTVLSFVFLLLFSFPVMPTELPEVEIEKSDISNKKHLAIYIILFALCLLTVLRVVPYYITTAVICIVLLIINNKIFSKIDYMLLLTFVCFFIISENLGKTQVVRDFLVELLGKNTLFTAVGTSQIISNVPAAVLLSAFTENWQALLQGVNIGGLGTPIASLASLITLKLYMVSKDAKVIRFLGVFTVANIIGLLILIISTLLI